MCEEGVLGGEGSRAYVRGKSGWFWSCQTCLSGSIISRTICRQLSGSITYETCIYVRVSSCTQCPTPVSLLLVRMQQE